MADKSPAKEASILTILASQNADGGWGYRGGVSWTEPTAYALLALKSDGAAQELIRSGRGWLTRNQRKDGGWAPHPSVDQSTWVTALAVLAVSDGRSREILRPAVSWLLRQEGKESTTLHRLRLWLLGQGSDVDTSSEGWPWYPETAGWVAPTALAILALKRVDRAGIGVQVQERVHAGRSFLMSRRCADGGWNHGSSRALGYEAGSYPESTGLALLALRGTPAAALTKSLERAEHLFRECRSAEGRSWLRMALLAHSRPLPDSLVEAARCRTVVDCSLCVLADAAANGHNLLLE